MIGSLLFVFGNYIYGGIGGDEIVCRTGAVMIYIVLLRVRPVSTDFPIVFAECVVRNV